MKKKKRKHIIIYIGGIVLILIGVFYSLKINRKTNIFEKIGKTISDSITSIIFLPIKEDVPQDNSYILEKNKNKTLEKEITELKKVLDLKSTYTDYDKINATVIVRNKSYWLDTISIDKGRKDGIKKNMAVITKEGLVGKIDKVYNNSSEVKLLTTNSKNYQVSVMISNKEEDQLGILNGFNKNNNLLIITGINRNSKIDINDQVTTSGIGGVFPKGIYIGKVEKIDIDKYNLSKTLYVKTNQEYNRIHYVTVLRTKDA
ncbi:MAG: rod shape-determining protein MreC [Bacilli bacterium]|nr:rod shape-determining protein MreC [Bacilli bacterium]